MEMIIGGAYQGKFKYAKANFKEGHQIINMPGNSIHS